MKKKSSISFGPGAASLILIFVVLTLSVLGMLSLMNSRSDKVLSARHAGVIEGVYTLNAQAEKHRAELDEVLYALRQVSASDEDYLRSLALVLGAGESLTTDDAFETQRRTAEYVKHDAGALGVILALGDSYDDFAEALTLFGRMSLENDELSWEETDEVRTLSLTLKILPLSSNARSCWVKYDLTSQTAQEW
ncbi:MAG: hypothetical protein IKR85_02010 [Clostridia bacterium]|nr:hypothetical protein [Clostridia bacterium]